MNIKSFSIALAALSAAFTLSAQEAQKAADYEFTTIKENPVTSIKNQYRSGTCWCFSALSFVESEILRMKG
ncbi:MAG: aminopeptidase, partial [Bacteroidales bacterium]|nr:aminopeptidase [Bacteroidales bacterium]